MVDRLSPERRSALMSKVRGKNTSPEMRVRGLAHSLGYRFRLHRRDLPGCPDIVFPSHKKIILVHGCFWHRHQGCPKATMPKSRIPYWSEKFRRNVERDQRVIKELRSANWSVRTIWECQTKDQSKLKQILVCFLGQEGRMSHRFARRARFTHR